MASSPVRNSERPRSRDGTLAGVVTLDDASAVEKVEQAAYRVTNAMSTELYTIISDAGARTAFERMQQSGVGRLLVVTDIVGQKYVNEAGPAGLTAGGRQLLDSDRLRTSLSDSMWQEVLL